MKKIFDDKSWSFLIAAPDFSGPIFEESVILLLKDGEDGSLGVIINRPTGKTLGESDADFEQTPLSETEIYDGGPVSKENLSLAVYADDGFEEGALAFGITPKRAIEIISRNPSARACAFAGYAGWGPEQLSKEIEEGTWILSNVDINLMFELAPNKLWEELLIRECPAYRSLPKPQRDAAEN